MINLRFQDNLYASTVFLIPSCIVKGGFQSSILLILDMSACKLSMSLFTSELLNVSIPNNLKIEIGKGITRSLLPMADEIIRIKSGVEMLSLSLTKKISPGAREWVRQVTMASTKFPI
jgi:hypothetical protein